MHTAGDLWPAWAHAPFPWLLPELSSAARACQALPGGQCASKLFPGGDAFSVSAAYPLKIPQEQDLQRCLRSRILHIEAFTPITSTIFPASVSPLLGMLQPLPQNPSELVQCPSQHK